MEAFSSSSFELLKRSSKAVGANLTVAIPEAPSPAAQHEIDNYTSKKEKRQKNAVAPRHTPAETGHKPIERQEKKLIFPWP